MSNATYFVKECPTCGRTLEIRVQYLGRNLSCQHCGGEFLANDPSNHTETFAPSQDELLKRAEQLLQMTARAYK